MNLYSAVNRVLKRLDDYPTPAGEREWPREEVELYVRDGYNAFTRRTKAVFDMFYPENLPTPGNYVAKWEENYFLAGWLATGLMNYTGGHWEQDYSAHGDVGPVNFNEPWELELLEDTFQLANDTVPEDNVTIERGTFNNIDLDPEYTRWYEQHDRNFQTVGGDPTSFAFDRDGIRGLRPVPAGTASATNHDLVLHPQIIAHWPFSETTSEDREDRAGTFLSSTGSYTIEDQTGIASTTGPVGRAALFVSSHSDWMLSPSIAIPPNGFALSFWIKKTTNTNFQFLFNHGAFGIFSGAAGQMTAGMLDDDLNYREATLNSALSDTSVWSYASISWDPADGKLHLYQINVNYGPNTTQTTGTLASLSSAAAPIYVGQQGTSSPFYLNGALANVTLWAKPLSLADNTWLWNDGNGRVFPYLYDGDFRDSTFRLADNYGYGLLRYADSEFGTWAPSGLRGTLGEFPKYFQMGGQYGIPRRLYSDTANTRMEYFRLGKDPGQYQFEIPDRYVKYVEFYAQSKALERDGPGQDLALAGHFSQRFDEGVERTKRRLVEHKKPRIGVIGGSGRSQARPGLARLPYQYGRASRYR